MTHRRVKVSQGEEAGSWYLYQVGNSEIGAHVQEQSLLFDMFKAFDYIESNYKLDIISPKKKSIFLHAFALYSKSPSNVSTMGREGIYAVLTVQKIMFY